MEYGCVLYLGAAPTYLHRFDTLQTRIEHMSSSTFPSLYNRRSAAIIGLVCRLLAGEGRGNLSTFCPKFVTTITRRSQRLHNYDPVNHLRFKNPCDFRTLDRFLCSWQVTAVTLWDQFPADLLLRGERDGWRTILKDVQKHFNDNVYMPVCT